MSNKPNTCSECAHYIYNNKCDDTLLLINRNPTDKACKFFKDVEL